MATSMHLQSSFLAPRNPAHQASHVSPSFSLRYTQNPNPGLSRVAFVCNRPSDAARICFEASTSRPLQLERVRHELDGVLFLQGGATTQFSSAPLNLCNSNDSADYVVTGSWSDKAFKEGQKYCNAKVVWNGKAAKYTGLPSQGDLSLTPGAKFLHICANETIHGVEFKDYPTPQGETLLIADMSSNFCSKPVDVSKFSLIYAGAQKNIGPSGVTIVIVRKDLLGSAQPITPVMLDYKIHADNNSLFNTPPCFGIYICGLVFDDLLANGGLEAAEKRNIEKAKLLYDAIDGSNAFFKCPVDKAVRSLMNVPFTMATPELEAEFIKEAAGQGMVQLKGHRSVGGIRASIYNAMPKAGVEKLVALMKAFQARHTS
ncbi:hypothetical protein GOP47_0002517 [Adiantum capillus-veneris]|uniref:phosphoserine transaminase n=1 Tax=Adiantum capillus-veneris TaxID=13818 RepID=A0A9D4VB24_ADICA|nr:hypothetical protein GOP47_0002517 [Adiantum capillus-veneris]